MMSARTLASRLEPRRRRRRRLRRGNRRRVGARGTRRSTGRGCPRKRGLNRIARPATRKHFPERLQRNWRHAERNSRSAHCAATFGRSLRVSAGRAGEHAPVMKRGAKTSTWTPTPRSALRARQAGQHAVQPRASWQCGVHNTPQKNSEPQGFVRGASILGRSVTIAERRARCRAARVRVRTENAARHFRSVPSAWF